MRKILIITLVVLWTAHSWAATHTVSGDCSASAVQAAIDSASAGDTIEVACTGIINWTSRVILSGGKTLKGSGSKTGNYTTASGNWPLTINVNFALNVGYFSLGEPYDAPITIVNAAGQKVNRVTGFKFTASVDTNAFIGAIGAGVGEDGRGAFRIDNNFAYGGISGSRFVYFNGHQGQLIGVMDNNVYTPTGTQGYISYYNSQRGQSPDNTCYGYPSYARPIGFGTNDFFFIENNYFSDTKIATSGGGGRIVVRYNTFAGSSSNSGAIDAHPLGTVGWHAAGAVGGEIYRNIITHTSLSNAIDLRQGKWIVWGNTVTSGQIQLRCERVSRTAPLEWKACSGAHCCLTIHQEGPACDIEYPTDEDYAACHPLPAQIQDTFLWHNKRPNGTDMSIVRDTQTYIAPNVDYWLPTYGTEEERPASCTPQPTGVYYGATDSGKLWACTTTNNWTLKYTPFTYPHPLRGDDPLDPDPPDPEPTGLILPWVITGG